MTKMTKKRVSELEGWQLNLAAAVADGKVPQFFELNSTAHAVRINHGTYVTGWNPSEDWAFGGPIIERERIDLHAPAAGSMRGQPFPWGATVEWREHEPLMGPTPLIAAMRAFVASKLGDEVEVPA